MKKILPVSLCRQSKNGSVYFAEANHPLLRGTLPRGGIAPTPFEEVASTMSKNSKRVPPALKHGIYSGIGLLPTESPAQFRKFRKQIFAELNLVGRLEEDIGDEIVCLEWRRKILSTYVLAQRVRAQHSSIQSELVPPVRYISALSEFASEFASEPHPDNPSSEELEVARKRANKRARNDLGAAHELVELGDVVTLDHLQKELAIRDRLDAMITRAYKKLAYVRAIKSMPPPSLPVSAPPLLEQAA